MDRNKLGTTKEEGEELATEEPKSLLQRVLILSCRKGGARFERKEDGQDGGGYLIPDGVTIQRADYATY